MSWLLPLLGGLGQGLIGGLAGMGNKRPPTLDPSQQATLDQMLPILFGQATATPTIDPVQQAMMYNQIAQGTTGANNAVTHALVSRGLGRSGLLGAGLMQNANQQMALQNQANLGLQQQSIQRQQFAANLIPQLLNVSNIPGQSNFGAFTSGMAGPVSYSIQSMLNNRNNNNSWSPPTGYNPQNFIPLANAPAYTAPSP